MIVYEFRNTNTIALMGHGYAANADNDLPTGNHITYSCSPLHLANIQLGSPLRIIGNTGVVGATSTQILASQLSTILALKPAYVLLHAVTNDAVNSINAGAVGTAGTTIDNIHQMIRALNNNGTKVILSKDMPRTGLTDAQAKQIANVYSFFTSNQANYRALYLFDMFQYGVDSSTIGNTYIGTPLISRYIPQDFGAGTVYVNPNTETSLLASQQLMRILVAAGVKPTISGLSFASDGAAVVGFTGDESIISRNALMIHTGTNGFTGTGFNPGPGRTYPQFYGLERFNAGSTTLTGDYFIHSRSDAGRYIPMFNDGNAGNVVQHTFRNTAATLPSELIAIRTNTANAGGTLAGGSGPYIIETEVAVRVLQGSLSSLEFRLARTAVTTTHHMRMLAPTTGVGSYVDYWNLRGTVDQPGVFDGIIRSEPFFLPASPASETRQVQLLVGMNPSSHVSVWVGRLILKRV